MKNRISSARTAAQKSTKVETHHPSSHSDGNTLVACSANSSKDSVAIGVPFSCRNMNSVAVEIFEKSLKLPIDTSALNEIGLDASQKEDFVNHFKLNNTVSYFKSKVV